MHGGEWIHGELGGLQAGDVVRRGAQAIRYDSAFDVALSMQVVMLSHSGSTSELLALPKRFQDAGCCVVSIVGDAASQLAAASNFVGATPTQPERLDPPLT